ncbi:hypothetical protein V1511DRAFT_505797 [Dipodascopsis uninucleata]
MAEEGLTSMAINNNDRVDEYSEGAPLLRSSTEETQFTSDEPLDPRDPATVRAIFAQDVSEAENGGGVSGDGDRNAESSGFSGTTFGASALGLVQMMKQKPRWMKYLAGVLGAVVVILILRATWHAIHNTGRRRQDVEVCMTPECITVAAGIIADADLTADPCEDFYQFTCGGWVAKHDLRPEQGAYATSSVMYEDSLRLSRELLEGDAPDNSPSGLDIWSKASGVYTACMDVERISNLGAEPLYPILQDIMSSYPVYEDTLVQNASTWATGKMFVKDASNGPIVSAGVKLDTAADLTETVLYLEKLAVTALVQFDISADDKDPDYNIMRIYQPMNGLPSKDYYHMQAIVDGYVAAIKDVLANVLDEAVHMVDPTSDAVTRNDRYEKLARSVVEFEGKLADIGLDYEELFDGSKTYNPYTPRQVQEMFGALNIAHLVRSMTGSSELPSTIIVTYPKYLEDLNSVLSSTTRETLQTYFLWKATEVFASHLSESAASPVTEFRNKLRGIDSSVRTERWKVCVNEVDSLTGWILGRYYVDKAFSPSAKTLGEDIINDIKSAFITKLDVLPWMDVRTKSVAISKVHNIVQKIGYPDASPDIKSNEDLAKYYKELNISATGYFENYMSARKNAASEMWSNLGEKTDRAAWEMTPATVNAYYNPPLGEIVFPAGILQPPVFSEHQPSYLNYGAFGAVAGHELSHAFDNQGRFYDERGVLNDWWTASTSKEFDDRAQCFVDQYSEYYITDENGKELHVNGKLTEGENIADNGGIAAAFKAWREHEVKNPSAVLPGLNLTKEQLFFVNYGRWWCSKSRPGTAAQRIYTDPHSPAFVRVLAAADDSQDFIDAFQCKNKQPRCVLW